MRSLNLGSFLSWNRLASPNLTTPPEVFDAYTDPFPTEESPIATYVFPRATHQSGEFLAGIERRLHLLADKPIEMVWGMKDVAFGNQKTIDGWRRYFPNAPMEKHEKASHYLQEDQPEAIAEAIRRVVARV